jgi:Family of unknown function (DUF6325)
MKPRPSDRRSPWVDRERGDGLELTVPQSVGATVAANVKQTIRKEEAMTQNRSLDELGPVDYLIVEFPAGQQNFTGEGVRELVKLHESGTIRVMDILILQKADDGTVMAQELGDLGDSDELVALEGQLVQTLAEDDVENLAAAMDPGSVAGVLVYENLWAAPFASATRRAGGQLIANGRIPIQALIAAVESDAALEAQGV